LTKGSNLRSPNDFRNISSHAVASPAEQFIMPALFARKANDADAPNP
jgi:hypothetical protein